MIVSPQAPIFVATAPVDLRWGFDKLAALVVERLGESPRDGALFVFLNKDATRTKILFYHHSGYCLLHKRLDRGVFPRPVTLDPRAAHVTVSAHELGLLLEGLAGTRPRRPPKPPPLH